MKQEMINFNDHVVLELTDNGEQQYRDYFASIDIPRSTCQYFLDQLVEGKVELPLWDVAHIFGPLLYQGGLIPFNMEMALKRMT